MLYCYVHLEIEALDEYIGHWETTWFKVKFSVCLCLCVGVLVCIVQVWLS